MAATKGFKSIVEALLAEFELKRPSKLGGSIGITTYISDHLRQGRRFCRANPYTKRSAGKAGQNLGRRVDAHVRGLVEPAFKPAKPPSKLVLERGDAIMSTLKRKGLRPFKTQVLVCSASLKIKSFIDIVAIDSRGHIVVVELKCTRACLGAHTKLYKKDTDKHLRKMNNGVPDTEESHHYLQAGFGALAMQHTYPTINKMNLRVRACVLVSCSDGTKVHTVPDSFMLPRLFRIGNVAPMPKAKKTCRVVIKPWPTDTTPFMAKLKRLGFNDTVGLGDTSEYVGLVHKPHQVSAKVAVALCIANPWPGLPRAESHAIETGLANKCKAMERPQSPLPKPNGGVIGIIVYPSSAGEWAVHVRAR